MALSTLSLWKVKKKVMSENLQKEKDDLKKLKSDNDSFLKLYSKTIKN